MSQETTFDQWWRLVMAYWKLNGRRQSIREVELRALYDQDYSPLKATERLLSLSAPQKPRQAHTNAQKAVHDFRG